MNDGEISEGTPPGTAGNEMTSSFDENTSEVTGQLPSRAPTGPIKMLPLPEVPNGACLRPDPLPVVPEFASPFPLPGSILPLHSLVDADLRTDQRPPLVRIQKPKALGEKTAEFWRGFRQLL